MSPALVETDGPVFCLRDPWVSARCWGELGCEGRVGRDCLGLEDGWFHQFDKGGGDGRQGLQNITSWQKYFEKQEIPGKQ